MTFGCRPKYDPKLNTIKDESKIQKKKKNLNCTGTL